ncbi:MAG: DHHW family protein [Oscillospiraceae bacterium]|jgi:hypothetical protein
MKKVYRHPLFLITAVFLIAVSLIDVIEPDREFSEAENKYLEQRPSISWNEVVSGHFETEYEEYIADQFLMRDTWIDMKSASETALLKIENNGIAYGKDGYLFPKFTGYDSRILDANMSAISSAAERYSGKITFCVVPSGYAVMQDKLPAGFPSVDQDELISEMYSRCEDAQCIDLLEPLRSESGSYIWYRTDHHWTTYGAYIGYEEICRAWGIEPVSYDSLSLSTCSGFYGTSYYKCKKLGAESDVIIWPEVDATAVIGGETKDSLYDLSMLEGRDKYAMFLWNNNARMDITSNEPGASGRILVIKDSFANELVPYLCFNYSEITVIDPRYYQGDYQELLSEDWDQILVLYNAETICTSTYAAMIGS